MGIKELERIKRAKQRIWGKIHDLRYFVGQGKKAKTIDNAVATGLEKGVSKVIGLNACVREEGVQAAGGCTNVSTKLIPLFCSTKNKGKKELKRLEVAQTDRQNLFQFFVLRRTRGRRGSGISHLMGIS